jgi:hypothetical protein
MHPDARTTPSHLRLPALALMGLVAGYLSFGFRMAQSELGYAPRPAGLPPAAQAWSWAGQFHMFNEPRPWITRVEIVAVAGAREVQLDLEGLYPTLRQEGPSYARGRFLRDPKRQARLAADICGRLGLRAPTTLRARVTRTPKEGDAPAEQEPLGSWRCP